MTHDPMKSSRGPFRADQLEGGDRYELSNGHPIYCAPARKGHGGANGLGAMVVGTDPAVKDFGIDVGFSPEPGTLRAPDVSVNAPDEEGDPSGWASKAPPLAIEYDDKSRKERALQAKIAELLAHGTRFVWLVRLRGPRCVEVYEPGRPVQKVLPGAELEAAGVLARKVPVEALYDPRVALDAVARNVLARAGYRDLDELRTKSREEGREEGIEIGLQKGALIGARGVLLRVLARRKLEVSAAARARIEACEDEALLALWCERAVVAGGEREVFESEATQP